MKYLQKAQWVTDKYVMLMLGAYPIFWGNDGYNNITKSKFLFFAAATAVWLAAVLVLLGIGASKKEKYGLRLRPVHWAMAAFFAVSAVSAIVSPFGGTCLMGAGRYDGFLTMVLLGAVFFGVSALAGPRRRYVWALAFSTAVCCIISFVQVTGVNFLGLYPDGTCFFDNYIAFNGAFLGTLGNAGITCAFLCLAAPVLAVSAVRSQNRRDRLLLIPAAMAVAAIVLCDVDAGYVALAACALVCAPLLPDQKKTRRTVLWAVLAIIAAGLTAVWLWPGDSGTLWEASRVLHGDIRDEFGSHRVQIWRQALSLVPARPLLGAGPGTAAARLNIVWTRFIEQTGVTRTTGVDNTHNVYLGYLLNVGILGLGAYLAAMACSFVTWVKRRHTGALFAALGAGMLCYFVQDFFGIGLVLSSPFLWLAWGLLESGESRPIDVPSETIS
jgi:O-antigen ligase